MKPAPLVSSLLLTLGAALALGDDPIRDLQDRYAATKTEKVARAYHFGSQGPGSTFSNHTSHTNRLIPIYTFGTKVDLGSVTGANSAYRDETKLKAMYGTLPPNTLNPSAEYCDQSDLYRVQRDAVNKGVKHLFIVWFDGMDWDTTRAAAVARSGKDYAEGKGSGLAFLDETAGGSARFGWYVTSPTHDKNDTDVDLQTVTIPKSSLLGGYDAQIAGATPWKGGPLPAPGYLKGQSADAKDREGVAKVGRVLHAYTDSAPSAGEFATGIKSYNNGINVGEDGRFLPTVFNTLQQEGWKVGTATSVPFDHASPAAMYAHNVHRDDYQDLARDMLGLKSIAQETGKEPEHPGLDVVLGAGFATAPPDAPLNKTQGKNAALNQNTYISDADLKAIDAKNGGKYVSAIRTPGSNGPDALRSAAEEAAKSGKRLFGMFGVTGAHLPYQTADGDFRPALGIRGSREEYLPADLAENPTLADMTRAALTVLSAKPEQPFALFVEAGDVDFALHDNNLDNAIGAVYSGDEAVRVILQWVEKNSNWDESALIVTADHGHYLVIDDIRALAGKARGK